MKAVLLLTILLFEYSNQQTVNINSMETDLMSSINFLDLKLRKVSTSILSCVAATKVASSNLKAASMPKDLTDPLDILVNYLVGLQFPDFFGSVTKCSGLAACDCLSYRIIILESFSSNIDWLNEKLSDDDILNILSSITYNYAVNYRTLQTIWTREVSIIKSINQTRILLNDFIDSIRNFDAIKKYFNDWKTFLISDISSCTFGVSTFQQQGSEIEENLRANQIQLQDFTSIALTNVEISINTVMSKKVQAGVSDRMSILISLRKKLRKILACDDYMAPKLTWPKIVSKRL